LQNDGSEGIDTVAERGRTGRPLVFVLLAVLLACAAWMVLRNGAAENGVEAFRTGRLAEAERIFLDRSKDPADVTARLYLARIYRRDGRHEEAAAVLREAAEHAPDDADVRRELGYLFLDLRQPALAIEQFRRAREQAPEEPLNWIGLIRALRAVGNPEAEAWVRRAPPEVADAIRAAERNDAARGPS